MAGVKSRDLLPPSGREGWRESNVKGVTVVTSPLHSLNGLGDLYNEHPIFRIVNECSAYSFLACLNLRPSGLLRCCDSLASGSRNSPLSAGSRRSGLAAVHVDLPEGS
jgi:hypothetical protein